MTAAGETPQGHGEQGEREGGKDSDKGMEGEGRERREKEEERERWLRSLFIQ